jgi:hypothetical protein
MKERIFLCSLLTIVQKQILEKLGIFSLNCAFFTRSQHSGKITKLKNKQNTSKKVQIRIVFSNCLSFHFLNNYCWCMEQLLMSHIYGLRTNKT